MSRPTKGRVAGLKHPAQTGPSDVTELVPKGMRVSAALAWRFIVVIAALYVIIWLLGYFFTLVIPLAIALLLAALMAPGVDRLEKWNVPRGAAAALVMIAGLAVVGGLLTFVILQFIDGLPQLQSQVSNSLDQIQNWLNNGPLHVSNEQLRQMTDNAIKTIKDNQSAITSGAITTAATIGEVLTGLALTLFILIFFLYDGRGIWGFLVRGGCGTGSTWPAGAGSPPWSASSGPPRRWRSSTRSASASGCGSSACRW
jgi:putative heme transporter